MKTKNETEGQPQVGSDACLGRWWLLYLLLGLTAYNVIFDWLFNRLGTPTIAWEGGVVTTLTWVWLLKRPNIVEQKQK